MQILLLSIILFACYCLNRGFSSEEDEETSPERLLRPKNRHRWKKRPRPPAQQEPVEAEALGHGYIDCIDRDLAGTAASPEEVEAIEYIEAEATGLGLRYIHAIEKDTARRGSNTNGDLALPEEETSPHPAAQQEPIEATAFDHGYAHCIERNLAGRDLAGMAAPLEEGTSPHPAIRQEPVDAISLGHWLRKHWYIRYIERRFRVQVDDSFV